MKNYNSYSTSSGILFARQFVYYPVAGIDALKVLPPEGRVDRLNEVINKDDFIPIVGELAQNFSEQKMEIGDVDLIIFNTLPGKTSFVKGSCLSALLCLSQRSWSVIL
ncbi:MULTISPECIES: hypothetical protein [Photorhabdus]|uniref:Uncharacterized protein n=2 Tax=Photorhabdus TaxID=29487 RepID=A0AAW6BMR7_9GAMM|nr:MULTISPECIES: hypothetical protein [Photorhabdus]EYU13636.1 hypothetical protein BA1DRAFT_03881 [Photorhabdus aegyptia]MDB6373968.1 hypothetical protein [Photorhabdus bodei]